MQGGGYNCKAGDLAKFEGSDNQVWNKVIVVNEIISCQDVSLDNNVAMRVIVSPDNTGDLVIVTGKCQSKTLPRQFLDNGLNWRLFLVKLNCILFFLMFFNCILWSLVSF